MVYVVSSYDFGGSGDANIHIVTTFLQKAQDVYDKVLIDTDKVNANNQVLGAKYLVELTEVPLDKECVGSETITLFWGKHAVKNNNN